jgi:hypothetical protein
METTNKIITLASFVFIEKIENFKKYLYKRFRVPEDKIFTYILEGEENKKLVTFRILLKDGKKINTDTFFPTTIIVHKKGECFYTINALNKLIDETNLENNGNIDYTKVVINWDEYQNKILIIKSGELKMVNIKRDFSEK